MDPGAILVGLAILVLAGAYILRPVFAPAEVQLGRVDSRLSALQAERDRILDMLHDLDMDGAMGKVPQAEYQSQRSALTAQGAQVLREIDAARGAAALSDPLASDLEDELEAEVAKLREAGEEEPFNFCTHCGTEVVPGDRFCTNCGELVGVRETEI